MSDIGVKLGVDGEIEFKSALKDINTNLKTLGTEMKAVTSAFDKNDTSVENLAGQNQVLNKQIDEQKNKLDLLKGKLAESAAEYGENDAKTQKWQQAVNLATADLNKMERQLDGNNKELDEAAKASDKAGDEVKDAGDKARQSGDDAEKGESGWSKLGSGLAQVGKVAGAAMAAMGAAAAAAGVALVKGLVDAGSSAAAYADDVATIATQTGFSTDTIQGMMYASGLLDVELESQTKGMAKVVSATKEAIASGEGYITVADGLTVSLKDANGQTKSTEQLYYDTIDALGSMTDKTAQAAAAQDIFGKSYQDMMPLIEAGSAGLKELTAEAERNGYILSGSALEALNSYQDSLDRLSAQKTAFTNAVGAAMAPTLQTFADAATDATHALTQLVNGSIDADEFASKLSGIVSGLSEEINKSLPAILEVGSGILTAIGDGIVQALPILATSAAGILTSLGASVVSALPTLVQVAFKIIEQLATAIISNLPQLTQAAIELLTGLSTMLIDNLPMLVSAALQIVLQLATGIADALPELIPAIVETVMMIVETLIDNIDMLIDASIAIIMALATGLIDALPRLIEKAPEIIAKLVSAIIENAPKLLGAAVELITSLSSGLAENFKTILTEVGGWVNDNIVQPIKDKVSDFVSAGGDLIAGVWQGISDKATWLWEQVSGFFTSLTDRIKNFFGIASPSKLFRDEIGANLADGIGVGFSGQMKSVAKQMQNSIPTSFDSPALTTANAVSGAVNGMAASMGANQGGGNYTINVMLPDGKALASVVFDPIRGIAKQRGVALA